MEKQKDEFLTEGYRSKQRTQVYIDKLIYAVSEPVRLRVLAEEAAELAQAALKFARVNDELNPTAASDYEAFKNLVEEVSDVVLCMKVLQVEESPWTMEYKAKRWCERLGLLDEEEE